MSSLLFTSCEKEAANEPSEDGLAVYDESTLSLAEQNEFIDQLNEENQGLKCYKPSEICSEYKFYPLIASQRYYAGVIGVYNDKTNLYVSYFSFLRLSDFHLFVGDAEALPLSGGNNPKIGHFPYSDEAKYGRHFKTFVIPLNEIPECYTLAAHATYKSHTIWAKSCTSPISFKEKYGSKRWGWVIEDCIEKCEEENVITFKSFIKNTQTGQADLWTVPGGGEIYSDGWCEMMNVVPSEEGVYDLVMPYAYPAGKIVGSFIVSKNNGQTCISIELDENEYTENLVLWKTHLFYGTNDEFATYVDGCPKFREFPLSITEDSKVHTYCFE